MGKGEKESRGKKSTISTNINMWRISTNMYVENSKWEDRKEVRIVGERVDQTAKGK